LGRWKCEGSGWFLVFGFQIRTLSQDEAELNFQPAHLINFSPPLQSRSHQNSSRSTKFRAASPAKHQDSLSATLLSHPATYNPRLPATLELNKFEMRMHAFRGPGLRASWSSRAIIHFFKTFPFLA
jgi:hypothetical protein